MSKAVNSILLALASRSKATMWGVGLILWLTLAASLSSKATPFFWMGAIGAVPFAAAFAVYWFCEGIE